MRHVLLVEDDAQNAVLLRKVLERRAQVRVTHSEDPEAILALVGAGDVDLVIMDVSLTHSHLEGRPVSGIEITRRLKAHPSTSGVPVLLATAHAMRGDGSRLLAESGADQYISKPIVDHAAFVDLALSMMERAA